MEEQDWGKGVTRSLGVFLNGATIPNPYPRGDAVIDDNFYLIVNAFHESRKAVLPGPEYGSRWIRDLDTDTGWAKEPEILEPGGTLTVQARSLVVLRHEA